MKKYVQNFWVRFLACLLCSVTLVTGGAAGVLIAGLATIGSKEEVYENGQRIVVENYAAYIYDHIYEGDDENLAEDIELIEKFIRDKNFTCSISKVTDEQKENAEKEELALYSNLSDVSDWDYEVEILEGAFVYYDVDSVLDALRVSPVIENHEYTVDAAINEYAFDANTGLFYYFADSQYFLANYISVSSNGVYYDYRLKNTEDGKKVYYNSFYDVTLDTSTYRQWDWVEMGNQKLPIAVENDVDITNEIRVVTDDSIQSHTYTGVYHENDYYNSISYYPDRVEELYIIRIKVDNWAETNSYYDDMFYEWWLITEAFYENESSYQTVLILSVILFILSFALLIYSANSDKEKIGFWNKVPAGCFTVGIGLIELAFCEGLVILVNYGWYGYNVLPFSIAVTLFVLLVFAIAFIAFIWLQNMITRFKTRTFIRYSEFYYGYRIWKWCWSKVTLPFKAIQELARENMSLFTRGLMVMLVISFVEFLVIMACWWEMDVYLFIFFMAKILEIPIVIFILMQMQKLQEGSKRIAAGDLSEPIDTSKMIWEFKKHGENINKVSDGIALAVEDRIKSERFKTELITNVSHDIKTPLTSIINYVDLIKKEEIQDETLKEYIEVLDRQSARLKKLIEDLMEASKASTGNLAVNIEDCDVEVLLTQLIGEFEEKLSANQLEVVVQKPEHPVIISADGRHMWRVLDNLLNNACKYSLPGTRVYVSLIQIGNETTITFKNISKAALNIPSDELMERFVRGDSSRNTEGSGLGLSIAQSLTELMKGTMKLEIDGDLFKVTLKFQATTK